MSGIPRTALTRPVIRAGREPAARGVGSVSSQAPIRGARRATVAAGSPSPWLRRVLAPYRSGSRETVICSMTPDRKIGSLYFDDGSRIRTTHRHGPARKDPPGRTLRFNVDARAAHREYWRARQMARSPDRPFKGFDAWMVSRLLAADADAGPPWATSVTGPESAFDATRDAPPRDVILFEIFQSPDGTLAGWHSSRGIAARLETDRHTLSVLHAALDRLSREGITDAAARNEAFYAFVALRAPEFAANLRKPEDV